MRARLLYQQSYNRLCFSGAGDLRRTVLQELHGPPLGVHGHFGRYKALSLARRSLWWQGMSAAFKE